jgi:hypothetical protein
MTVFKEVMKKLECAYGYDVSERRLKVYKERLLQKFTDEEFKKAADSIIDNNRFFPSISDFNEHRQEKIKLL